LALPAAIILIALSVGLFGLLGPQLRRHTTPAAATATPTPTSCSASDLRASLPPQSDVQDISMTSPRDGWAVGSVGAPINATAPHSLILRFQNCQWQSFGDSIPATELDSVSMTSPTDGWAVGLALKDFTNTTSGVTSHQWNGDQLITLHYQNGQWQRVTIAGDMAAIHAKVRMTPAGDGWMLIDGGKYHINPYYPNSAVTLLHYENGQWIPIPLTFDASKTVMLWDIAATESDDCWVVGYGFAPNDTFAIGHYHQGVWTTYSGGQLGLRYPVLYTVAMSGPNDIWVAGSYSYKDANGDHSGPLVFHFDGSTWTRQQVGVASDPMADLTIMSLAVASPGEVWGHNWGDGGGQIYSVHLKDGVWTWTAEPHMAASIGATTFVSSSEGFAVEGIYALDGNGQQAYTSEMLHYANGTWSVIPSH
jgi:hypothetical protein